MSNRRGKRDKEGPKAEKEVEFQRLNLQLKLKKCKVRSKRLSRQVQETH